MRRPGWICIPALSTIAFAAGDSTCADCHREIAGRFAPTPMARALTTAAACDILQRNKDLVFQDAGYESRVTREGDRSMLTVSGGGEKLTANLLWAFGRGQAGQTYVFELDGTYYESRVSYYNALHGLDLTMGARPGKPKTIEEAAGHRLGPRDALECFGCHSSGAVSGGKLRLESIAPGVACESCHGPAARHVEAVRAGNVAAAKMAKLGGSTAEEISELCGRCHRTWSQIATSGPRGVLNVRFQPYRLTNSRCYSVSDARIRCTACHDPHGPLETAAASYDAKCATCHSAKSGGKTCTAAKSSNCVTCHMPKIELPGAHARFTDHQIRIARAGDPYPN
ncbi:MAG TPA: multiheme c-type cytochrome [Candidatus Acidoferrales bacterium]|nr:multiheme c-type cytochrome [Candidatus Acidoferrales bacterium]